MPRMSLAVDGSVRTFNCVKVVPCTGVTVEVGGGGAGVSDDRRMGEGGSVAVMTSNGVAVGKSVWAETLQLVTIRLMRTKMESFECTE